MAKLDEIHADMKVVKAQMEWQNNALDKLVRAQDATNTTVIQHTVKHKHIDENLAPKVDEHDKKFTGIKYIIAAATVTMGALFKLVELWASKSGGGMSNWGP